MDGQIRGFGGYCVIRRSPFQTPVMGRVDMAVGPLSVALSPTYSTYWLILLSQLCSTLNKSIHWIIMNDLYSESLICKSLCPRVPWQSGGKDQGDAWCCRNTGMFECNQAGIRSKGCAGTVKVRGCAGEKTMQPQHSKVYQQTYLGSLFRMPPLDIQGCFKLYSIILLLCIIYSITFIYSLHYFN